MILAVLWLLAIALLSTVQGYQIDPSCTNVKQSSQPAQRARAARPDLGMPAVPAQPALPSGFVDKSSMIDAAAQESLQLLNNGATDILTEVDDGSILYQRDTIHQILPGISSTYRNQIKANYQQAAQKLLSDSVVFYCNPDGFRPAKRKDQNNIWSGNVMGITVRVEAGMWESMTSKIIPADADAMTVLRVDAPAGGFNAIILLSQLALTGTSVATLAELYQQGKLRDGTTLDSIMGRVLLSGLMTHEIFHALDADGQEVVESLPDEDVGWDALTGQANIDPITDTPIGADQESIPNQIRQADTYVYVALAFTIPRNYPQFFVYSQFVVFRESFSNRKQAFESWINTEWLPAREEWVENVLTQNQATYFAEFEASYDDWDTYILDVIRQLRMQYDQGWDAFYQSRLPIFWQRYTRW